MIKAKELDYVSRINGKGGSPPNRDTRPCPEKLREFSWRWAIDTIADGNESYFIHNPNAKARFSEKAYKPLIPILWEEFPKECQAYFGGREEKAAKLIANRIHKMYYCYTKGIRGRGISREHPKNWKKNV